MKKFFTLLAAVSFCLGSAAIEKDGDWYQIRTAQDLVDFSAIVNGGTNNAKGVLMNDIDMSGVDNFTPIGLFTDGDGAKVNYSGEFNGNGYVVKNLKVVIADYEVGLFSRLWFANVYRLGIVDSYFESTNGIRAGAFGGEVFGMTVSDCFSLNNEIVTTNGQKGAFAGEAEGGTTFRRCYTEAEKISGSAGNLENSHQGVPFSKIMSGELCFELNNRHTYTPLWRQDLRNGGYPVVNASVPQVSKLLATGEFTNDHNFVDGVCRECFEYFYQEDYMTPEADGYFHISTPEQMMWFSVYACHNHGDASAKLDADIDMSGITDFYGMGIYADGGENHTYSGTFNGQGHVISNLTVYRDDNLETGFFGRTSWATVSNLGFTGDITVTNTQGIRCGVLGGELVNSSINNVFVRANSITYNSTNEQKGALGGEGAMSTYTGCYTTEAAFTGNDSKFDTYFNHCYNNANGDIAAKAVSGELCAILGAGWFQNLDNGQTPDEWPTLDASHGTVYLTCDASGYSNSSGHNYQNGICQNCSQYEEPGFDSELNAYTIGNLGQLIRFSEIVNTANQSANGSLTSDIDMQFSDKFTSIGLNNDADIMTPFRGTFYGNNHVIRNIYVKTNCEGGLFSRLIEGKIYNLGVENGRIESTANLRCGAIAGEHHRSWMYNCFARGTFEFVTGHTQKDALAAEAADGHFVNCYTTLPKLSCDYPMNGTSENCYEDVTTEQAATGELCYMLGDAFGQTIGTDEYPELGGAEVSYVGEAGYATLYNTGAGYELYGDVKAYIATRTGSWLQLTQIENVPAGTPVVLKGGYFNKVAQDLPAINIANDLKGADADIEADGTMYILAKVDDKVGFYKAVGTIATGKAYYQSTSSVKAFYFAEDDATSINEDLRMKNEEFYKGAIYNVAGQRMNKIQKGLNIVNGKKALF